MTLERDSYMMQNAKFASFDRLCEELGCEVSREEPMSRHTTFKVGGPADRFVTVTGEDQLSRVLRLLSGEGIPYFLLGNGSNLLVSDRGYRGAVVSLGGDFRKVTLENGAVRCGAGASLSSLCAFARDHSLTGLEFAWGIPGTAGGAAYMNAGAYGGEMRNVLASCRHVLPNGETGRFIGEELKLSYRRSAYTGTLLAITSLELTLEPGDREQISARMEELMARRKSKQPLEYPSAGSTFKRPEGYFAAALIEECGLKGFTLGGAQVSEKHSGFVINRDGATCADILALIEHVKSEVRRRKGVELECEVKFLGEAQ